MAQQSRSRSNNNNELLVPQAASAIEQMKLEIASEFGVQLGAETTSRANGSVGGACQEKCVSYSRYFFTRSFRWS
ncbi:alpha/beta-type small acid-soluble spore protein [Bacillus subtilis]|uniref:alpha/beta-type small acid-soluble spore protein n=1 Tax=Bacillus subtilis TaxID=1423 RepID=UPI001ABDBBB5|nr:alpha/beta-type small acid-soluble spore protein [Bacillus subtilis]MBO3767241.1 alpha/beta-type small acid-soluble spore protein [Bacillus subtilis]